MSKTLSISVVIATFNSERTLELCLKMVTTQAYPKSYVEIITADGGSNDKTLSIAKKYGAKIFSVDPRKQNAEYNKGIGLSYAKNEIVLFLDHDNIMPHKNWLTRITQPFLEDERIIASEPLRFYYGKRMTLLDRYFALLGGSDPVVYYLGKNSHLSWAFHNYNLLGEAQDLGKYYKVKFSKGEIPALGGNGAAIRRKMLLKHGKCKPSEFVHTDVIADLIHKGYNDYAIVKESIMHLTNNKTIPFLRRRVYFIEKYQLADLKKRRYRIYDPRKDKYKLAAYIILSLTLVIPLLFSIRGYVKKRDVAWFLHPLMCIAYLFMYSLPVMKGGATDVLFEK